MADPLMLADARPTRFARPGDGAVELVGRSPAIARVQELIRRGAALDGGALITAEAGAGVEAVARELHHRGRASAAPYVAVHCDAGDPGQRRPAALRPAAAGRADRSRIGRGRQLHRRRARRHAVPAQRHRAPRVGPGAAGADRARRRSPHRRRAGRDRGAVRRQRAAGHRRRRPRAPLPRRSLSPAVGGAHRSAAAARSARRRAGARGAAAGRRVRGRGTPARAPSRRPRSRCSAR